MKQELREAMRQRRREIPAKRRLEAERGAIDKLLAAAASHRYVLSYASFGEEFSTKELNLLLEEEGKLLLPRISGGRLHIYHLTDSAVQFVKNAYGIPEPCPEQCAEVEPARAALALVPGLAFDREGHRLGYGGGYYDRLLFTLPASSLAYGVGFREQLLEEPLPTHAGDVALDGLFLF